MSLVPPTSREVAPHPRRTPRAALALAVGVACLLVVAASARWAVVQLATVPGSVAGPTRVAQVIDGDTIEVTMAGHRETVRLLGIDTPETKDPRKPVQCFGAEASRQTSELLPPGTPVHLVRDVEARDRYDRLLAYVYRADDGLFVNLELARGGWADVLTYPPNVAHTAELNAAVAEARHEQRGLWGACGGPGRPA